MLDEIPSGCIMLDEISSGSMMMDEKAKSGRIVVADFFEFCIII